MDSSVDYQQIFSHIWEQTSSILFTNSLLSYITYAAAFAAFIGNLSSGGSERGRRRQRLCHPQHITSAKVQQVARGQLELEGVLGPFGNVP